MAVSTINTVLKFGTVSGTLTKLCAIKSYPDLIGKPEKIETTDLESTQQSFVAGVKQIDDMEFGANFDKTTYAAMAANEGTAGYFELDFGTDGADGKFTWQGTYSLGVKGGEVNGVREMTITVTPSTDVVIAS